MCFHYKTTIEYCLCSENKVECSNYKHDHPCFHLLLKGTKFEPLLKLNLTFSGRDFLPEESDGINDGQDKENILI